MTYFLTYRILQKIYIKRGGADILTHKELLKTKKKKKNQFK